MTESVPPPLPHASRDEGPLLHGCMLLTLIAPMAVIVLALAPDAVKSFAGGSVTWIVLVAGATVVVSVWTVIRVYEGMPPPDARGPDADAGEDRDRASERT